MIIVDTDVMIRFIPPLNKWNRYLWIKSMKKLHRGYDTINIVHKDSFISWSTEESISSNSIKISNLLLLKAQLLLQLADSNLSIFMEECGDMKYYFVFLKRNIFFVARSKENLSGKIRDMLHAYKFLHKTEICNIENVSILQDDKKLYTGSISFKITSDKFVITNIPLMVRQAWFLVKLILILLNIMIFFSILSLKRQEIIHVDQTQIQIAKEYERSSYMLNA